jgi:galactoside O-acetyltransferase
MSYYSEAELAQLGLKSFGERVHVSRKASFYGADRIELGSDVRIDDFCVLSAGAGGIVIGNFIHIAVFSSLIGRGAITVQNFSNISSRVSIYSSSDDYSGKYLTNPTVPEQYTGVQHADVTIGRHAIIGSGSVVLPGVTLAEGVAIGALSLVRESIPEFEIWAGSPAKKIGERKRYLLLLERDLLAQHRN